MESLKCITCSPLPYKGTAILTSLQKKAVENQMGIIISSCKYCMRIELTACGKVFSRNCSVRSKWNLLFAYSWPRRISTLHFMKSALSLLWDSIAAVWSSTMGSLQPSNCDSESILLCKHDESQPNPLGSRLTCRPHSKTLTATTRLGVWVRFSMELVT